MSRLSRLPSDRRLIAGLIDTLSNRSGKTVSLIKRERNDYASTHPSEIVTCSVGDQVQTVLIKYGLPPENKSLRGRDEIAYEARVYRDVLAGLSVSTISLRGTYRDEEGNETWILLGFIPGCSRLDYTSDSIVAAARWLGRFHAEANERLSTEDTSFLKVYGKEYYGQWANGATRRLALMQTAHPWLADVFVSLDKWVSELANEPLIVIHGEFYLQNVLSCGGKIYPVDWESTAFGFGEIDLMSLVDGQPPATADACVEAYKRARWSDGNAPDRFEHSFALADIYWNIRWLTGRRNREPFDPQTAPELLPRVLRLKRHHGTLSQS